MPPVVTRCVAELGQPGQCGVDRDQGAVPLTNGRHTGPPDPRPQRRVGRQELHPAGGLGHVRFGPEGPGLTAPLVLSVAALALLSTADDRPAPEAICVTMFAAVSPPVISGGVIVTGNSTSRYFIRLTIFPLLALLAAVNWRRVGSGRQRLTYLGLGACVILIALGIGAAPQLHPLLSSTYLDEQCFTQPLGGKPASGVGNFFISRPLDLYNTHHERALQALPSLDAFAWLISLGSYEHRQYTFVLVDRLDWGIATIRAPAVEAGLGLPAVVQTCPGFYVCEYFPPTRGFQVLNTRMDASVRQALASHG